jgi:hypothetical protein
MRVATIASAIHMPPKKAVAPLGLGLGEGSGLDDGWGAGLSVAAGEDEGEALGDALGLGEAAWGQGLPSRLPTVMGMILTWGVGMHGARQDKAGRQGNGVRQARR